MLRRKSARLAVAALVTGLMTLPAIGAQADHGIPGPTTATASNGNVFELVHDETLDWKSARKAARRKVADGCRRAHLATITTPEEQAIVESFMTPLANGQNAWIGGRQPKGQKVADKGWRWITRERWDFTAWNEPTEPNDGDPTIPRSEQYLEALGNFHMGLWNDAPGSEEKFYIVESERCNG